MNQKCRLAKPLPGPRNFVEARHKSQYRSLHLSKPQDVEAQNSRSNESTSTGAPSSSSTLSVSCRFYAQQLSLNRRSSMFQSHIFEPLCGPKPHRLKPAIGSDGRFCRSGGGEELHQVRTHEYCHRSMGCSPQVPSLPVPRVGVPRRHRFVQLFLAIRSECFAQAGVQSDCCACAVAAWRAPVYHNSSGNQ